MVPSVGGEDSGEGLSSQPSAATAAAAASAQDDRASLFDGYSYRERDATSILLEEDEPLSPVDRASGELGRSSFEYGGRQSGDTRRSINALTSEASQPSIPDNDSTSTINEDTASSAAPSTVEHSSEALPPSSPDLPPSRLPSQHHHRQRSGIPALDRNLPSDIDADEDEDDEDDDWDLVEKPRDGRGEQNGSRGTTLFARGVVDRYRLGVLKKKESRASGLSGSGMSTPRSFSAATMSTSASTMTFGNDYSPPESKIRRGLTFGKSSKFKVRPKPVSSQSYTTASIQPATSHPSSSATNPSSSSSIVPSNISNSYSLPANLATNGHGGHRRSDHSAASSSFASTPERASSTSPTKGLRVVSSSTTGGEESDAGGTSSSRISGQERIKMGKEKMMSLFGVKSSASSQQQQQPAP